MKHLVHILLLFLFIQNAAGQIVNADDGSAIFNQETTIDLRLHTKGWSIAVAKGLLPQIDRTTFKSIEIGEIRHPKQDKRTFDLLAFGNNTSNRTYVYGKQNNLYFIKYNIGLKRYLTEKSERKGLAVGYSYSVGPMLGLVKPYLIDVFVTALNDVGSPFRDIVPIAYEDGANEEIFLDDTNINGAAGWTKGWNDVKIQPGIHLKGGLHLDWGAYERNVQGLEIGIMADIFFRKVPIMIIENNRAVFINMYVNAHFGRRK